MKLTFVLFDEIEKANDALWNLLLGILDKGTLTLGDNRKVDFSNALKPFGVEIRQGRVGKLEGQRYVATGDVRHAMEQPAITDRNS